MWLDTDVASIRGAWYFNDDDVCHNDVKDILRNLSVRRSHHVQRHVAVIQVIPLELRPHQHSPTDVQRTDDGTLQQPTVNSDDCSVPTEEQPEEEQTTTCSMCGVVLPYGPQCFPCIAL